MSEPPDKGGGFPGFESTVNDSSTVALERVKILQDIMIMDSSLRSEYLEATTNLKTDIGGPNITHTGKNESPTFRETHKERPKFRFESTDSGPFIVYTESTDKNIGNLHPMSLGKMIHRQSYEFSQNIVYIERSGKNRVKIEFDTFISANRFLDSSFLADNKLEAYVPAYLIRRQGIIHSIDLDITESELKSEIRYLIGDNFHKLIEVKRMTKKILREDKSFDFTPTTDVILTFRGKALPEKVILFGCIRDVSPFKQRVIQCHRCFRYGHTDKMCRSEIRCGRCGNTHATAECESPILHCLHCDGTHASNDRTCPMFQKQKVIKNIMAERNISFKEAIKTIDHSFSGILSHVSEEKTVKSPNKNTQNLSRTSKNFPTLYSKKRKLHHNESEKLNEIRRKHAQIISNEPSTSGNGVCLNQHSSNAHLSSRPDKNISDLSKNIINMFVAFLQEISGSNPINLDESHQKTLQSKLRSIITSDENEDYTMEC
ncbi:uncharacterized protein LOC123314072 [Coccinella septempunctata]|uniref:uncharacterized protein LOC123314072 n=1 Tax=Coccinella septempunctata TaxID=41139 RepID=UPI001D0846C0|nr:uncharacterized protein LOC123314072 [Coccinella septempunctata]